MHKLSTATFINAHKILVTPLVLGLMSLYSNWSTEAFVYLALHGTYSLFVVLGAWVFGFFARNMLRKDRSLACHPRFAEYKSRTGLLFPRVFPVAVDTGSMRHL